MHSDSVQIWRRSDTRLVGQAVTTFTVIAILGLVIAGLYFLSPRPTRVLGTDISSGGK